METIKEDYPELPEVTVTLQGAPLVLRPFKSRQLPKAIKLARPILGYFAAFGDTGEQRVDYARLIGDYGDPLIEIAALAIGKTPEELDAYRPDELVDLMRGVLQVNLDFFFSSLKPSLERMTTAVATHGSASAKPGSG